MNHAKLWNRLLSGAPSLGCLMGALALEQADVDRAITAAREYHIGAPDGGFRGVERTVQATQPGDPLRLRLEEKLVELATSDADIEARRLACRTLWVIGGDASAELLLTLAEDPEHFDMACYALRNHPWPDIDRRLVVALPESSGKARIALVNLLGDRRADEAVAALRDFTAAEEPLLAEAALAAIGRIGTPAAGRALMEIWSAAGANAPPVLLGAALQCAQRLEATRPRAAGRVYSRLMRDTGNARLRAAGLLGLVRLGGPDALALVSEALGDQEAFFATTALSQVATLSGEDVTAVFARRLETLPVGRRAGLLRALTARNNPALLPTAVRLAAAGEEELSVAAIDALGKLGDASVAPLLIGVVSGKTDPRRAAALSALREVQGNGVNETLQSALPSATQATAAELIALLADRGATGATPQLLQILGTRGSAVDAAAFRALARLADVDALPRIAAALTATESEEALAAATDCCLQIARRHEAPHVASGVLLSGYAGAAKPSGRAALLHVLAGLADANALAAVTAALHDDTKEVRDVALRLLADWPDSNAMTTLLALARAGGESTEGILALRGVLRLLADAAPDAAETTLSTYGEALALTRRDEERRLALAGLGESGQPGALELILPFLDNPALHAEAASAVLAVAREPEAANLPSLKQALRRVAASEVPAALREKAAEMLKQTGP